MRTWSAGTWWGVSKRVWYPVSVSGAPRGAPGSGRPRGLERSDVKADSSKVRGNMGMTLDDDDDDDDDDEDDDDDDDVSLHLEPVLSIGAGKANLPLLF